MSPSFTQSRPSPSPLFPLSSLPKIDLSVFTEPSSPSGDISTKLLVASQVDSALRTHGFFSASNLFQTHSYHSSIFSLILEIFRAPHEQKCSNFQLLTLPHLHGYVPLGTETANADRPSDLIEGYLFVHPTHESYSSQSLRGLPDNISDTVDSLWQTSGDACKALCEALELSVGLEKGYFYEPMKSMELTNVRFNYYPGGTTESGAMAKSEHVDTSVFTLLVADRDGLMVRTVQAENEKGDEGEDEGGNWVKVNEGELVVFAGDLLTKWSNGRWTAARHKVVQEKERCSLAVFFQPFREYMISAHDVFVQGQDRLYKDVTVGECLDKLSEAVWAEENGENVEQERTKTV